MRSNTTMKQMVNQYYIENHNLCLDVYNICIIDFIFENDNETTINVKVSTDFLFLFSQFQSDSHADSLNASSSSAVVNTNLLFDG